MVSKLWCIYNWNNLESVSQYNLIAVFKHVMYDDYLSFIHSFIHVRVIYSGHHKGPWDIEQVRSVYIQFG